MEMIPEPRGRNQTGAGELKMGRPRLDLRRRRPKVFRPRRDLLRDTPRPPPLSFICFSLSRLVSGAIPDDSHSDPSLSQANKYN